MELRRTETGFALYKEKEAIGHCTLHPAAQGAALAALAIDPAWRRKGYGSYLLKEVLRSFGGGGQVRGAAAHQLRPLGRKAEFGPEGHLGAVGGQGCRKHGGGFAVITAKAAQYFF